MNNFTFTVLTPLREKLPSKVLLLFLLLLECGNSSFVFKPILNSDIRTYQKTLNSCDSPEYAYITNGGSNSVSVINTSTNTVIATIPVGSSPQCVSISPNGNRVYISNQNSHNVSVINTSTNTVVATIAVGTHPEGLIVSPDGSNVYVTNESSDNVSVINTSTNTVVATIPAGMKPVGVSISPDGSRLYVTNYDANTVTVINTSTNAIVATIPAGNGPRDICISPDGSYLYVASFYAPIKVINTATNTVVPTSFSPNYNKGISISPDGSHVYVANYLSNTINAINTSTNTVDATIAVGTQPEGISVSPDGSRIYVVNKRSNTVSVINSSTNTVLLTIPVGSYPASFGNFIKPNTVFNALPIELLYFKATVTGSGNLLTWQTANEVNNKGFQVESINSLGIWKILGFIDAKGKTESYTFMDEHPLSINYYRLRQIDNDGKETLSKVVSVSNKKSMQLKVYPSVTSGYLNIEVDENQLFQIVNLTGQQVLTGKTTQQLDVSSLPKGTYILKIGEQEAKFVKQ